MANEKRLIDANEAKKFAREHIANPYEIMSACAVIDSTPTVDAVEVKHGRWEQVQMVRCKDCDKFCPEEIRKLYNTEKYCMRTGWVVKDDDFCSYGERRSDERETDGTN